MIQRIQSLYLLLAAMFAALATFLPIAHFEIGTTESYELFASGLRVVDGVEVQSSIYMFIIALAMTLLPFATIFFYDKRMFQIRLCVIEVVFLIGYFIMVGTYYYLSCRVFEDQGELIKGIYPVIFAPIVSILLCYLAGKAIFKDEMLVRSADRIR